MKKLFTNLKVAMTLLLLCGVCSAWGENHTGTFKKITSESDLTTGYYVVTGSGNSSALGATANSNNRIEGVSVTITDGAIVNPSTTVVYLITKNAEGYSFKNESTGQYMCQVGTTSGKSMGFKNEEINITLAGYNSASPVGFKFTLDGASNNYFKYNVSSGWFANYANGYTTSMTPVDLYKLEGTPANVATPTFTPAATDFLGSTSVTIACATEGASIYYTLDGTEPTKASTPYTAAISINETTTVKAIAYKDGEASNIATKTFTKVTPLTTMDAIYSASATAGNYWITFNNWVISGVKGSNAYLTDNAGKGMIIYKSGHGFAAGDILSGTVKCALTIYNGSAEVTDLASSAEGLTVTKGGTLNTVEATIADLGGVNTGAYVNLGALTYNGTEFTNGTNTIKPYNTFITLPTLTNGKKYYVKGVYIQFGSTQEIAPLATTDFEEVPATKYEITITPSTNGSVTVDATDNKAQEGQVVTLTVTPTAHYALSELTVTDASSNLVAVADNKFTMPASNVTVNATFAEKEKFTVTYTSLGASAGSEKVYDGETVVNAPTPTYTGWTFAGWTTTENYSMSTTSPELFNLSSAITADIVLYAVYSKTEGGNGSVTATLTNDEICASDMSNSYGPGSITNDYGTWNYNASKQGNYNKDGEYFIQIRSNATVSYIQVPEFSGDITSIVLNKVCNTSKGKYTGSLYFRSECANEATAIATATSESALDDVTLTIPAGYRTGYIMSSGACRISSITVNYASGTTYYTTTITPQTQNVEITSAGYATAYIPFAATVEGATAYYVTVDGDYAKLNEINGTIPANTGVVIKGDEGTATFTESAETLASVEGNLLIGTAAVEGDVYDAANTTYYILSTGSNGVGFYWDPASTAGEKANCAQYKAVLAVSGNGAAPRFISFDEATGIEAIHSVNENENIYNLNGVRVNGNYKGIVIINGKKVVK